jgi:hypothetical protein
MLELAIFLRAAHVNAGAVDWFLRPRLRMTLNPHSDLLKAGLKRADGSIGVSRQPILRIGSIRIDVLDFKENIGNWRQIVKRNHRLPAEANAISTPSALAHQSMPDDFNVALSGVETDSIDSPIGKIRMIHSDAHTLHGMIQWKASEVDDVSDDVEAPMSQRRATLQEQSWNWRKVAVLYSDGGSAVCWNLLPRAAYSDRRTRRSR